MSHSGRELLLLPGRYSICRLPPNASLPHSALAGEFWALLRSNDELSLVCAEELAPPAATCSSGWRCLRVAGTLDFALTGVLAGLSAPLAAAGISIFAVSSYDTDYLLLAEDQLPAALAALRAAGFIINPADA
jgi:hypothetical protein